MRTTSDRFPKSAGAALTDATLQASLDQVRRVMPPIRAAAAAECDDFAQLCDRASDIRRASVATLDSLLETFERTVVESGGHVHWARDGEEATRIVAGICAAAGARRIIKSKSMVTEEIELNAALEAAGYEVTETDLGEYIIQLRGEKPSHILAPSLHVTLEQVGETFHARHGIERDAPPTDADEMLLEARRVLRDRFLNADVGITGANLLVAATGGAVIVTNEGNADLSMLLPDTHIVVTGIEKVVASPTDAGAILKVLARSAIGERMANYTTFVHGPRRDGETVGPENYHVVLVDNGRSELLRTEFGDMLRCIRCSACLNHCPVYTAVGGHAYGSVYSGPMGAVLTPAFAGLPGTLHLPQASTLCGRCATVCPVGIPLPSLLRRWREQAFDRSMSPAGERVGLRAWRFVSCRPFWYRTVMALARTILRGRSGVEPGGRRWIRRLPGFAAAWTDVRDLPAPAAQSFQSLWRQRRSSKGR